MMLMHRFAFCLCLGLISTGPAFGADAPTRKDLLALQFYASSDDQNAVQAELTRLQSVFPNWSPPNDLAKLFQRDADLGKLIDRIYVEIAEERFEAARTTIQETELAFPEWQKPDEMMQLLRVSEAQKAINAAWKMDDLGTVVAITTQEPGLLTCERVNNAWILAEAYLRTGREENARAVYSAIIGRCDEKSILVATIEKADPILSERELTTMVAEARASLPNHEADFVALEKRLLAGRTTGPAQRAMHAGTSRAPAKSLRPVERTFERVALAQARNESPSALQRPVPAAFTGVSDALYQAVETAAWQRCLELTHGNTTPSVLAQRGWCAYNAERPLEALSAFRTAHAAMAPSDEQRDTGYGILLAMLKLGQTDLVARDAMRMPLTHDQRVEIEGQILDRRGVAAFEAGQHEQAIAFIEEHKRITGSIRRDLEMIRGYALLNLGRRQEARAVFETLHAQLATQRTSAALRAAR